MKKEEAKKRLNDLALDHKRQMQEMLNEFHTKMHKQDEAFFKLIFECLDLLKSRALKH